MVNDEETEADLKKMVSDPDLDPAIKTFAEESLEDFALEEEYEDEEYEDS